MGFGRIFVTEAILRLTSSFIAFKMVPIEKHCDFKPKILFSNLNFLSNNVAKET